ncbi:EAL and HDOD domain-containing protein [Tissierella creatinophila]|uniref:EAL domain protein n=1 Tax=Tissierella creatinophila DSM 6911 TaxID=1123403 RepID=A0A1U7M791_TISCR|nr:EAL domain-containing protein [Tissierella creatinophila]OLS03204.1 EAL domain protein [Tissierella creatinophila DSM 6911]
MFIARQPIFNRFMIVYGYELLYRDSKTSTVFGNVSAKKATATVLGGLFELGIDTITDNEKAFINFDYEFLLSDSIELINPEKLIIEVLEDVEVDKVLIKRLIELKKHGYKIALDDFVEDYDEFPLVPISDIIKYDIIATPLDSIRAQVRLALHQGKTLLAEKIETKEEYEQAKGMGFSLFQGYFFEKPSIVGKSNDKKSTKFNYLRLIAELGKPEPSYNKLAKIIGNDVNLAYRLLRVVKNSQSDDVVYSIKRALVYMGFRSIERWINILMLQDLATDKPLELTRLSLTRSKFGEGLANHSKFKSRVNEASTMLLFSTLDAILDQSMEEALDGISLTEDIREALIHRKGELSPLLELVYSYEKGDWDKVKTISSEIGITDREEICNEYLNAIKYCTETMDML